MMFHDEDCTIKLNGREYTSGGAFLCECSDGICRGIVYGEENKNQVRNWHGNIRIPAHFGRVFRGNFGDRRCYVWFTYQGHKFYGLYAGMDYNQLIRVKEIK